MGNQCQCQFDSDPRTLLHKYQFHNLIYQNQKAFHYMHQPLKHNCYKTSSNSLENVLVQPQISTYYSLVQKLVEKRAIFEDQTFPIETLFKFKKPFIFLRPSQIFPQQTPDLCINPQSRYLKFLSQYNLQTNLFYFTMACQLLTRNAFYLKQMFKTHYNQNGFYLISIFYNGQMKDVVVDDIIPCSKEGRYPIFTKSDNYNIWPLILQKLWAKLLGGYQYTFNLKIQYVLQQFMAITTKTINIKPQTISKIISLQQEIVVLIAKTKKNLPAQIGIRGNQLFQVVKVMKVYKENIFALKSPLQIEYKGKYDRSTQAFLQLQDQFDLSLQQQNECIFINQNELLQNFQSALIGFQRLQWQYFNKKYYQPIEEFFQLQTLQPTQLIIKCMQYFSGYIKGQGYQYSPVTLQLVDLDSYEVLAEGQTMCCFGAKSLNFFQNVVTNLKQGKYIGRMKFDWVYLGQSNNSNLVIMSSKKVKFKQLNLNYQAFLLNIARAYKSDIKKGKIQTKFFWLKQKGVLYMKNTSPKGVKIQIQFVQTVNLQLKGLLGVKNGDNIKVQGLQLKGQRDMCISLKQKDVSKKASLKTYELTIE